MMRYFLLTIFLFTACQKTPQVLVPPPDDELISIETYYALSTGVVRDRIQVLDNGLLKYESYDIKGTKKAYGKLLNEIEMRSLEKRLQALDWSRIAEDEIFGLDGTSVKVIYDSRSYSLWTPSHKAEKRGLVAFLDFKKSLYEIAK